MKRGAVGGQRSNITEEELLAEGGDGAKVYDQIVSLLLAGGYFRARIRGLSPFDKVIGGLAWCITAAAGDVDVDLWCVGGGHTGVAVAPLVAAAHAFGAIRLDRV